MEADRHHLLVHLVLQEAAFVLTLAPHERRANTDLAGIMREATVLLVLALPSTGVSSASEATHREQNFTGRGDESESAREGVIESSERKSE